MKQYLLLPNMYEALPYWVHTFIIAD